MDDLTMNCEVENTKVNAKCSTKKTEIINSCNGDRNSNSETYYKKSSSIKHLDANKRNGERRTLLREEKMVQIYGYQFNATPIDDLTSTMLSTPPSIDQLFTAGLSKRMSVSSTPKSSLKSSLRGSRSSLENHKVNMDDLTMNCEVKNARVNAKRSTKKTEIISLCNENRNSDSETNYKESSSVDRLGANKQNEEKNTFPKVEKRARKFGYRFNTTPIDDLTSTMLSSPPSIDQLFTAGLSKRMSVSSTPKSSRSITSRKLMPGKGSLKNKRMVMSSLKRKSHGYEDDLFENSKLNQPSMLDDSGLFDISFATPKCAYSLSPTYFTKTPRFKDCYSPSQLFEARKVAEEYMHRRKKRRRNYSTVNDTSTSKTKTSPLKDIVNVTYEDKRLELQELVDFYNKRHDSKELNEDSEEDDY